MGIVRFIKRRLLLFLKFSLKFLSVDKKLVIFGARFGDYYMDNSRYLFEWILLNEQEFQPIWVTKSNAVYRSLKNKGYPVKKFNTIYGTYLLYRAKTAFITNELKDISLREELVPKRLNVIFLGHGKSVKGTRLASKEEALRQKWKKKLSYFRKVVKYSISTSPFIKKLTEDSQGVASVVTGYPRNDQLINPDKEAVKKWDSFCNSHQQFNKTILYAPSWRVNNKKTSFFPFDDFSSDELYEHLEKNKILLLIRPHIKDLQDHPETKKLLQSLTSKSPYIELAVSDDFLDVNDLLPFIDLLITDYSSIYHDYLLLNRPIMFIPYDFEEFSKQNGLVYDYFKDLPGPAVNSFIDFIHYLNMSKNGFDPYKKERKSLSEKIHSYFDDQSCKRVFETFMN